MIRIAIAYLSLLSGSWIAHAQNAPPSDSLFFSPGPLSDDVLLAPAAIDQSGAPVSRTEDDDGIGRLAASIREAEEEIEREESLNGASSRKLIEQLESLAALYRELGDYPFAIAALERARQIARINDGLYSLSQVEIMEAMVDSMEEAGAYYESDSLQAEILELAGRNEGDARVPTILAAIADRQIDAVTEYFAAGSWERSLERIDAAEGTGWDLQDIELLRNFVGKKPLKRHDAAIREALTNGSYEIGDTLDAREELVETYAMIDAVNDYNEAGQRKIDEGGLVLETKDRQRDLALSAFRRARRLYSSAMQTLLEFGDYGSGEYLAIEQKMIDTYYFELEHAQLYPDFSLRPQASVGVGGRNDRQGKLKPVVYGTGTSVLEAKVVNLLSHGASAVEIARALMRVGDWHLLFSANRRALEMYRDARDLLVREGVPAETLTEVVSPAAPVILAELTSDDCLEFDPTHTYSGYIDIAVETGRYGQVKEADIVSSSADMSPNVERRARTHVYETRFRPRFKGGQPMRSDRFTVRYYYDYREPP
jgi:tetratricopeptide (TPR) repeat protein